MKRMHLGVMLLVMAFFCLGGVLYWRYSDFQEKPIVEKAPVTTLEGSAPASIPGDQRVTVFDFLGFIALAWGGDPLDYAPHTEYLESEIRTVPLTRGQAARIIHSFSNLNQEYPLEWQNRDRYAAQLKDYVDLPALEQEALCACYIAGIIPGQDQYIKAQEILFAGEAQEIVNRAKQPELRNPAQIQRVFYAIKVPETVKKQMQGKTLHQHTPITLADLRYLRISHWGFDGEEKVGEMIVHQAIAEEVLEIFQELYHQKYALEKMILPDAYQGSDEASMRDNNSSSFNDRPISTDTQSYHQYGLAIDLNPLYNPYYNPQTQKLQPSTAGAYLNREEPRKEYIVRNGVCYQAFIKRGWNWGGDFHSVKDYQHFEKRNIVLLNQE